MTANLKIKKNILLLICGVIVTIFSQNGWSAENRCTINDNGTVRPTDFDLTADVDFTCWGQPDTQQVIFYKIAACKSALALPTIATPLNLTSCTTVFESTTGAAVDVSVGITNPLVGTFTFPPVGTYTFLYLELDPTFTYQQVAPFNSDNAGTAVNITPNDGAGGAGTIGSVCWSNGTTVRNFQTNRGNVSCGTLAQAAPVATSVVMNSFFDDLSSVAILDTLMNNGKILSGAFIKADKTRAIVTAQGVALANGTRMAVWGTIPINVTANMNQNYVLSFTNTLGISAMFTSLTGMNGLSVGAFDIDITID